MYAINLEFEMNKIVGALWERQKDGNKYYSGVLTDLHGDIQIAVFPNNRKQANNQPDMNIVISFDRPQKEAVHEVTNPSKNGKKKKVEEPEPF